MVELIRLAVTVFFSLLGSFIYLQQRFPCLCGKTIVDAGFGLKLAKAISESFKSEAHLKKTGEIRCCSWGPHTPCG